MNMQLYIFEISTSDFIEIKAKHFVHQSMEQTLHALYIVFHLSINKIDKSSKVASKENK